MLFHQTVLWLVVASAALITANDFQFNCAQHTVGLTFMNGMTFPMSFDIQSTNQHCIDSDAPEDEPECTYVRFPVNLDFDKGSLHMKCSAMACNVNQVGNVPLSFFALKVAFYGEDGVSVIGSEEKILDSKPWFALNETTIYFTYNPDLDPSKFKIKYDGFFINLECVAGIPVKTTLPVIITDPTTPSTPATESTTVPVTELSSSTTEDNTTSVTDDGWFSSTTESTSDSVTDDSSSSSTTESTASSVTDDGSSASSTTESTTDETTPSYETGKMYQ